MIGVAQAGTAEAILKALRAAGLPVDLPPSLDRDEIVEATRSDKKGQSGKLMLALPRRIGDANQISPAA